MIIILCIQLMVSMTKMYTFDDGGLSYCACRRQAVVKVMITMTIIIILKYIKQSIGNAIHETSSSNLFICLFY